MPYYRKKSYTNKRRYKKKNVSTNKPSLAIKKYVKRVVKPLRPEVKRIIDFYTENNLDGTLGTSLFFEGYLLSQGTGKYQRLGNECRAVGLHMKGWMKNNSTYTSIVRTIVFRTFCDTDTVPATMELFRDANNAGGKSTVITSGTSPYNIILGVNTDKFHVVYDKTITLGATGSTDGRDVVRFNKFFKFNRQIKFEPTTSGLGNQSDRYFVAYVMSEAPLDSAGGVVEISGFNKWFYTDT